ncbi:MAG: DMT family transporter [Bacteroidaceae bacterium]|nr:DMT family transporter [Bacteroidaceae bacterium]
MAFVGETIALLVSVVWTVCALFTEGAVRRIGTMPFNVVRMTLTAVLLSLAMWLVVGSPLPSGTNAATWLWLGLSGLVGFVAGDICLFNSYLCIGSRFGQLLMTAAPVAAAFSGWVLLGETMSPMAVLGMVVVTVGIGMSVLNRGGGNGLHRYALKLPLRGVLYGLGGGVGQGLGLVLSKMGMEAYRENLGDDVANAAALDFLPFTATFIRAVAGLVGYAVVITFLHQWKRVPRGLCDRQGMKFAAGAVITGPVIGVSLSLMATLYTSTGVAQTLMSLSPVLILLPAWLWQRQRVTRWEIVGAVIAVVGAALFFV